MFIDYFRVCWGFKQIHIRYKFICMKKTLILCRNWNEGFRKICFHGDVGFVIDFLLWCACVTMNSCRSFENKQVSCAVDSYHSYSYSNQILPNIYYYYYITSINIGETYLFFPCSFSLSKQSFGCIFCAVSKLLPTPSETRSDVTANYQCEALSRGPGAAGG